MNVSIQKRLFRIWSKRFLVVFPAASCFLNALNDAYTEQLVVGNSAVQLFYEKYMRRYMVEK